MSNIEWGPEIAVDGKRPDWLKDDDKFLWCGCPYVGTSHDWDGVNYIRLPADHPHYHPTPAVDWSKPIEAVHEDGRIVPVTAKGGPYSGGAYQDIEQELGEHRNFSFKIDGTHPTTCGWRIRNVAEPEAKPIRTAADMLDRLEALARRMAGHALQDRMHVADYEEAAAIVAEMTPPVDPDLIEARAVKEAWLDDKTSSSDPDELMALCIKRGRELERGE